MYYVSTDIENASDFVEHIVQVHLGVGVSALSLQDDLPGTPQGRRTRCVKISVSTGYACPGAYPHHRTLNTQRVSLHHGVPAV